MNRILHVAAGLTAMVSTSAQAAEPACVTRSEVNSVIAYFAPVLMDPVISTCKPHLAPDAYLLVGGRQIADSLALRKDAEWKVAKATFSRLFGDGKMNEMSDAMFQQMMTAKLSEGITGKLKPQECKDISTIGAKLAPLGADGLVDLVGEVLAVAMREGGRKAPFTICAAQ
jgi:hypothetical protein